MQADVSRPEEVERLIDRVRDEFGSVDLFINNARGEVGTFYEPAMSIGLDKFDAAMDSQARAFLVGVRRAATIMPAGGRVVAITYNPGGVYGSWQSWVGMGAAKSALEVLVRYFAVALAPRGITVNAISHGWTDDSVLNTLPDAVQQMIRDYHTNGWTPMRRLGTPADRERRRVVLYERSGVDHRSNRQGRRWHGADGSCFAARHSTARAAARVTGPSPWAGRRGRVAPAQPPRIPYNS